MKMKKILALFVACMMSALYGQAQLIASNPSSVASSSPSSTPTMCPMLYAPVCGVDGKTYGNSCQAGAAKVAVAYNGECKQSQPVRPVSPTPPTKPIKPTKPTTKPGKQCRSLVSWVCGVDGRSYKNVCQAEKAGVAVMSKGKCGTVGQACSMIYSPVCGVDGSTYSNDCEAKQSGVAIAHTGECAVVSTESEPPTSSCSAVMCMVGYVCKEQQVQCFAPPCNPIATCVPTTTPIHPTPSPGPSTTPTMCPMIYSPVCGTDGKTYSSDCTASGAGAMVSYRGECNAPSTTPVRPTGIMCNMIYAPVCGVDGTTYSSSCFASNAGVAVAYQGECGTAATTPTPVVMPPVTASPTYCTMEYNPVCGQDGQTYFNQCLATSAGTTVASIGACGSQANPVSVSSAPQTGTAYGNTLF